MGDRAARAEMEARRERAIVRQPPNPGEYVGARSFSPLLVLNQKLNLRADFAYQSSQTLYPTGFYQDAAGVWHDATTGLVYSAADVAGTNAANTGKAHILVNASGTLTLLEDKLDVTVWGKNLTNLGDYVNALAIPQLGFVRSVLREPRTYGVTATVRF